MQTSTNRRLASRALWTAAALILSFNLARVVVVSRAQALTYKAFTILRTESGYDTNGVLKYTNHYEEAVRGDGSRMWKGVTGQVQQRRIFFANGDEVRIDDVASHKRTYPHLHAGPTATRNPASSCSDTNDSRTGWTQAGQETIGQYAAIEFVRRSGPRTTTAWYTPDYGCAMVQLILQHETGVTRQDLAALIPGEPDPSLFRIAESVEEVPPSITFDPCSSGAGNACSHALPDVVKQRLDSAYYAARAK